MQRHRLLEVDLNDLINTLLPSFDLLANRTHRIITNGELPYER